MYILIDLFYLMAFSFVLAVLTLLAIDFIKHKTRKNYDRFRQDKKRE